MTQTQRAHVLVLIRDHQVVSKILKSCTKSAVDENSNVSSQWRFKVLKAIQRQSAAWYILVIYVFREIFTANTEGDSRATQRTYDAVKA